MNIYQIQGQGYKTQKITDKGGLLLFRHKIPTRAGVSTANTLQTHLKCTAHVKGFPRVLQVYYKAVKRVFQVCLQSVDCPN